MWGIGKRLALFASEKVILRLGYYLGRWKNDFSCRVLMKLLFDCFHNFLKNAETWLLQMLYKMSNGNNRNILALLAKFLSNFYQWLIIIKENLANLIFFFCALSKYTA